MQTFYKDITGIKVQYLNSIKVKKPNCIYVKDPTINSIENALDNSLIIKAKMVYLYGKLSQEIIDFYSDFPNLILINKKISNVIFVNFRVNQPKIQYKEKAKILYFNKAN
jgi:hypothetical protein